MKSKSTVLLAVFLAAPARAAQTASQDARPAQAVGRYNLIMISLGNVGTAHMSLYGYPRETTPALDRWARQAIVFENAFSPASWTLPVGTSLFTSLYPYAHGVNARDASNALNKSIPTLPGILKRAGFATAAFTGGLDYYKGFSHMRDFETAPDNPEFTSFQTTLPQAARWLSAHERERFFLFIHGYDAHCPFVPPPAPFRGAFNGQYPANVDPSRCLRAVHYSSGVYTVRPAPRCAFLDKATLECPILGVSNKTLFLDQADVDHLQDLYDEDILSVDGQVGKFLASLSTETLAQTIIVVYCEHGELFAKHGLFGRPNAYSSSLHDDVIHVPLLVRLPRPVRSRVRAMVSIVDIMPTLLDLLGIPNDPQLKIQGKDLRPLLGGKDGEVHDRIYAGSYSKLRLNSYSRPLFSETVRDTEWKLIHYEFIPKEFESLSKDSLKQRGQPEPRIVERLYHVAQDPEELSDLAKQRPDVVARLREDLHRWREDCLRMLSDRPSSTRPVPASLLRAAKDHGYW
jgi:arylsulfatase A-like enzyme